MTLFDILYGIFLVAIAFGTLYMWHYFSHENVQKRMETVDES